MATGLSFGVLKDSFMIPFWVPLGFLDDSLKDSCGIRQTFSAVFLLGSAGFLHDSLSIPVGFVKDSLRNLWGFSALSVWNSARFHNYSLIMDFLKISQRFTESSCWARQGFLRLSSRASYVSLLEVLYDSLRLSVGFSYGFLKDSLLLSWGISEDSQVFGILVDSIIILSWLLISFWIPAWCLKVFS